MINRPVLTASERRLVQYYAKLDAAGQDNLMAFAEFLAGRQALKTPSTHPGPVMIPALPGESVIAAIKRLSASYAMLDRQTMLHETAALVTQHMVQGRAASEVIAELEVLFVRRYQETRNSEGVNDESDR